MSYRAETDGVDHINASGVGRTMLGLMLHNGAYTPIVHPLFGNFVSIAGFWGWLVSGRGHEVFRHLYGEQAFQALSTCHLVGEPLLRELITEAVDLKLNQNLTLMSLFQRNGQLPYVRYGERPFIYPAELAWVYDDRWTLDVLTYFQAKYATR